MKSGRDILEAQYRNGRSLIEKADWARDLYDGLRRRCPHVPEEQLVRLFHDRSQSQLELIQGAATFAEYNAAHPLGRKKVKVKVRPRPALRTLPSAVPAARPPASPRKAAAPARPVAKKAKAKTPRAKPRQAVRAKVAVKAKRKR